MLYGFSYLTVGEKGYEPYTAFGLWFAENKIVAVAEIEAWNQSNGVTTNGIQVNLIANIPTDVHIVGGRLVR